MIDPAAGFTADPGLATLFLLGFAAATLLPLGAEWYLALLVLRGADPTLAVAVATLGNTLGAFTTYLIGFFGGVPLCRRLLRIPNSTLVRGERQYRRYGAWSLLFTWVPLIGDPLCAVAGVFRFSPALFTLLAGAGKLARYVLVAYLALQGEAASFA